jgi:hypothetical protein
MGYSTREVQETLDSETLGTHFSNALAFVVESLADDDTPIQNTSDLENMELTELLEWCDMYNFSPNAFRLAIEQFTLAVHHEVTNAFWNGECRNCMENPPAFN